MWTRLKIYTLQHFYIYIGTYVGVCAPFVFPMKNSVFSTCFSFAVVALPPLTTTNTRLHHKRSTLRLHPNQDAQLLPLSYRPGTLIHPPKLHFQASSISQLVSCYFVPLSTLFFLYPILILFLLLNDFMTCNLSHLPPLITNSLSLIQRAHPAHSPPLQADSHRETQRGPRRLQGDTFSISLPLSP